MALPWVFGSLTTGSQPASKLDDNFNALGAISSIPCTVTGTSAYTLVPVSGVPTVAAYTQLQAYRGVVPNTSAGAVTAQVGALGFVNCYKATSSGPAAMSTGDAVANECYDFIYDVALNSGSGGFHVYNVLPPTGGSQTILQVVNVMSGAVDTTTTVIPYDDSKPQNTEGKEFMTLAVTPTNVASKLKIDVVFNYSTSSGSTWGIAALYQDTTADALAAASLGPQTGTDPGQIVFTQWMTAGTTSATTFKVRGGPNAASTMTFNGTGGNRRFGGVMASSITITEIA